MGLDRERYNLCDVNRWDIDVNVYLDGYWCFMMYIRMLILIGKIIEPSCVRLKSD